MKAGSKKVVQLVNLFLLLALYQGCVVFVIQMDQELVDDETFMEIGLRFQSGE